MVAGLAKSTDHPSKGPSSASKSVERGRYAIDRLVAAMAPSEDAEAEEDYALCNYLGPGLPPA